MLLDVACYPDVDFHSPIKGREGSSSCCSISLSVKTCELKYDVNFVTSEQFNKHENVCYCKHHNLYFTLNVTMCLAKLLFCDLV